MSIGNKNKNDNKELKDGLRYLSLFAQKARFAVGTESFKEDTKNVLWEVSQMGYAKGGTKVLEDMLNKIKGDALTLFDYKRPSNESIKLSEGLLADCKGMIGHLDVLDAANSLSFGLVYENIMMRRDTDDTNVYEIKRRLALFNDKSPKIEGKEELFESCSDALIELNNYYKLKKVNGDSEECKGLGIKVGREFTSICSDLNDFKTRFLEGLEPNEKDKSFSPPAKVLEESYGM